MAENNKRTLIFRGSRYWVSNVWGATIAGLGAFILMLVVAAIRALLAPHLKGVLVAMGLEVVIIAGPLVSWPGNMLMAYPYEVIIEKGKGIRLRAAMKQLYIPSEDLQDVQESFSQGYIVSLKRRRRLLTRFVIHRFFDKEGEPLIRAIQEEIGRSALSGIV